MPTQFTLPPNTRAVGTGNPPADMDGVVDTLQAAGAQYSVLNAAWSGGADPTGASLSDSAFSAAAAAAAAADAPLLIPPGTYTISATLNWKLPGLVVRGAGWANTVIQQNTANIPVAAAAGKGQEISGLTLTYQTAQTSGQTGAICLTLGDDTIGSCFMSSFRDLFLQGGSTLLAMNPAVTTVAGVFSCTFSNINFNLWSVSAINLTGSNGAGGANCTGCVFSNIYMANANASNVQQTATSFAVLMKLWDEFVFNQLNVEHCTLSGQDAIACSNVRSAVFNSVHCEALTISANGKGLLDCSQTDSITVNGFRAFTNTYSGASSNPVVRFATSAGSVTVNGFSESGCTVTTPSHPLADFGSIAGCSAQFSGVGATQTTVNSVNTAAGDALQTDWPSGGIVPGAAAFTSFPTGGGANLINSTSGGNTTMVAGTWYYAALWVPYSATLTGIVACTGNAGGTDSWIVALWNGNGGTALANSALAGTAAPAANTKKLFPFTGTVTIPGPGAYIIGLQSNGTTAKFLAFANAVEGFITGNVAGSFGTVVSLSPSGSYNANAGPMASTY